MNSKELDLQKFMDFILFQEYKSYRSQVGVENILNQSKDGYPKKAMEYNDWLDDNDLFSD